MKKLIFLSAVLPLPLQAALVELWRFNDIPAGPITNGTITMGDNGNPAVVYGAGSVSVVTGGEGSYAVDLPGGDSNTAAYIDLPNGIISARTDATFETWVTQDSITNWGRIFDFGTNTNGEQFGAGGAGQGNDYLILSFNRGTGALTQLSEVIDNGVNKGAINTSANLSLGVQHHVVMTWDDIAPDASIAIWYLDGLPAGAGVFSSNLNDITDNNNWLGRSNWGGDANSDAKYDQFAIYDTAWTPAEVAAAYQAGPVPEPSTHLILAGSLLALGFRRRRA